MKLACFRPRSRSRSDRLAFLALCAIMTLFLLHRCLFMTTYNQPEYDEAFYASPAISLYDCGTLENKFDFPRTPEGAFVWHSIGHSILQGALFSMFGHSIQTLRIPALFYGMAVFLIFLREVRRRSDTWIAPLFFSLLFATDKTIVPWLFNGRPDPGSAFFLFLSISVFDWAIRHERRFIRSSMIVLAGALLGFSWATALRTAVACVFFPLLLFLYRPASGNGNSVGRCGSFCFFLYGLSAILTLGFFLVVAFLIGGGEHMSGGSAPTGHMLSNHFGFEFFRNVFRHVWDIPKYLLFYGASAWILFSSWDRIRKDFFILANGLLFLGFFFFVKETGEGTSNPYSMMILPFVELVLALSFEWTVRNGRFFWMFPFFAVLAANVFSIGPRLLFSVLNPGFCREREIETVVAKRIPVGATVVADPEFFFALKERGDSVVCLPQDKSVRRKNFGRIVAEKNPSHLVCRQSRLESIGSPGFFRAAFESERPKERGGPWLAKRYGCHAWGIYEIVSRQ